MKLAPKTSFCVQSYCVCWYLQYALRQLFALELRRTARVATRFLIISPKFSVSHGEMISLETLQRGVQIDTITTI